MLGDQRRVFLDIQMNVWLCWVVKGVLSWIFDGCIVMLGGQRCVILGIQMDVWLCWVVKGMVSWISRWMCGYVGWSKACNLGYRDGCMVMLGDQGYED